MTEAKRAATAPALSITRQIPATPEQVFAAWATLDTVKRFMAPGDYTVPDAEMDFRVGGRFRIVMAGKDVSYSHEGEYREINPPHRLVFTWVSQGTEGRESVVSVDFLARAGGTEITLTHEGLPNEEARGKHEGGWMGILEKLASTL